MLVPAKCYEASKLKKIAVLPFDGRGGNKVRADIEALLVGIVVKNEPYFKVIERAAINRIVKEQSFQLSGAVDEETASQVGKLLGADGIVLGAVTQSTEDASYSEKRSVWGITSIPTVFPRAWRMLTTALSWVAASLR